MVDTSDNIAYLFIGKYPIRATHSSGGRVHKGYIAEY